LKHHRQSVRSGQTKVQTLHDVNTQFSTPNAPKQNCLLMKIRKHLARLDLPRTDPINNLVTLLRHIAEHKIRSCLCDQLIPRIFFFSYAARLRVKTAIVQRAFDQLTSL
jgi:hypothetical protein